MSKGMKEKALVGAALQNIGTADPIWARIG
jgi:hypothetical protein